MRLSYYFPPCRFFFARKYFERPIKILDIGCANDSPKVTKIWFPNSIYHGVDIVRRVDVNIDKFYLVNPDQFAGYDAVRDEYYDFVILNHVVEHLKDPNQLVDIACSKLKPDGLLWIAFPSPDSLNFPSGVGTLNFSDDPTHIHICDIVNLSNKIISNRFKIIIAGKSRDPVRFFIGLCLLPIAIITRIISGRYMIKGLWYLYGFEDRIIAIKNRIT